MMTTSLRHDFPNTMKRRHFSIALLATSSALLAACSRTDETAAAPAVSIPSDQAYASAEAQAKGFTVGAMMGANPVYVLFDPQCPHCSHLWLESQPLLNRVKFVWAPVSIINAKSLPQGAALMQSANPLQAMTEHETSLLAGQGGMSASSSVPADVEAIIKANTRLLDGLGADSVPFIVAKNARSGQVVTHAGALNTQQLADFLGVSSN